MFWWRLRSGKGGNRSNLTRCLQTGIPLHQIWSNHLLIVCGKIATVCPHERKLALLLLEGSGGQLRTWGFSSLAERFPLSPVLDFLCSVISIAFLFPRFIKKKHWQPPIKSLPWNDHLMNERLACRYIKRAMAVAAVWVPRRRGKMLLIYSWISTVLARLSQGNF